MFTPVNSAEFTGKGFKKSRTSVQKDLDKGLKLIHECGEMILVEDNKEIMNEYVKSCEEYRIPFKMFENGKLCLDYIQSSGCMSCDKCKKTLIFTDF